MELQILLYFILSESLELAKEQHSVAQDLKSVNRILKRYTIQMKATEQYFPVVLFIMLYKVVLTFESVNEILSVTIQMKAIEQYFLVVLFIMLFKVVLTLFGLWMKS